MSDPAYTALPTGPLRDLLAELHSLRRKAGGPGGRVIEAAIGRSSSHTTILKIFKEAKLPNRPLLLAVGEALASMGGSDPLEVRQRLDLLWTMADTDTIEPTTFGDQTFRLGPLRSELLVVEGDGELSMARDDIRLLIRPEMVEVPPEVAEWKAEIVADNERREREGRKPRWNGLNYAVTGISISREEIHESSRVAIHLIHSDYFTFLAAQQLDRPLRSGETLRSKYLDGRHYNDVPPFLSCSFGVNVAVTTADDYALFSKRSSDVSSRPNVWNPSVNEGLSRGLDSIGAQAPDLYSVAERALKEEAALHASEYQLELLAITLDVELHQWGCVFWARLKKLTAEQLKERLSRGVQDKWEHRGHAFVRFRPYEVLHHLARIHDQAAPSVVALYFFSLVRRFGRAETERATAEILAHSSTS